MASNEIDHKDLENISDNFSSDEDKILCESENSDISEVDQVISLSSNSTSDVYDHDESENEYKIDSNILKSISSQNNPNFSRNESYNFEGRSTLPNSNFRKCILAPDDAFRLFFDDEILNQIVEYTNDEAKRILGKKSEKWEPCDSKEIFALIGLLLIMGSLKVNHLEIGTLWGTDFGISTLRATMSKNRFRFLMSILRFDKKKISSEKKKKDKLAPIRNIWEAINKSLEKYYIPGANITIGEQLVPFHGRCSFKQYMPSKPAKYGIAIWWACDSKTSYPLKGIPYLKKETKAIPELSRKVACQLVETYYGSQRNVSCDNHFTDLQLAFDLLEKDLTFVGAVKKSKSFVPKEFLDKRKKQVGSSQFVFFNNFTFLSYTSKKNRNEIFLSTMHHDDKINEKSKKPEMILYYEKTKGAVESLDQFITRYSCRRKTNRWSMAFFMNLIDVSAFAAYILWLDLYPEWATNGSNKTRSRFLRDLGYNMAMPFVMCRGRIGLHKTFPSTTYNIIESSTLDDQHQEIPLKRRRCYMCPIKRSRMQKQICNICKKNVCNEHSTVSRTCFSCKK